MGEVAVKIGCLSKASEESRDKSADVIGFFSKNHILTINDGKEIIK